MSIWYKLESFGKRELEKMTPPDSPGGIFLIINHCRKAQYTGGNTVCRQVEQAV